MDIDFTSLGFGTNFSILDWIIVIGYLIAIVCIGVYIRKYIASLLRTLWLPAGDSKRFSP